MSIVYLLFLLSGRIKVFLSFLGFDFPVDLTLILALLLVLNIAQEIVICRKISFCMNSFMALFFLLLFYGWLITTLIWTPSETFSQKKGFYFSLNLLAFIYPIIISKFNYYKFIKWLLIFGVVLGVINMSYFYLYLIKLIDYAHYNRVSGEYIGIGLLLGINIIILLFTGKETFFRRKHSIAILLISVLLLVLSVARGSLIFTILVILLYCIINFGKKLIVKRRVNRNVFFFIAVIFIAIIGAGIYFNQLLNLAINRYVQLFNSFFFGEYSASYNLRTEYFKFAFENITNNMSVLFFGNGVGSFGCILKGYDIELYPHNLVLELLFEFGLVGLVLFAGFTWFSVRNAKLNFFLLYILIFYLLNSLKSFSLLELRLMFAFFAFSSNHKMLLKQINIGHIY